MNRELDFQPVIDWLIDGGKPARDPKHCHLRPALAPQRRGARVLLVVGQGSGQIRRGDAEKIHAVIWFCDLRDSTPLADAMGPEAFLALLNEYFECVLSPVLERDGQVLRFIGDAGLAIFPAGQDAATRAVDAAKDAIARMQVLNERRENAGSPRLRFGIGLHLGDVLYGIAGQPPPARGGKTDRAFHTLEVLYGAPALVFLVVSLPGCIADHAARHRRDRTAANRRADCRTRGSADQRGLAGAAGEDCDCSRKRDRES